MENVTLRAVATSEPIDGGMRFTVVSQGDVQGSIRRMVSAHAAAMRPTADWRYSSQEIDGGAVLTVLAPPSDLVKLKALGFMGLMTTGMHHQAHHLMIARGHHPHH